MDLYIFLSVIVVCITFIICFILGNFTNISDYHKYRKDHYELEEIKNEYNENIDKYRTKVEDICDTINNIKNCDIEFIRNYNKVIRTIVTIKHIYSYKNYKATDKLGAIDKCINDLGFNFV